MDRQARIAAAVERSRVEYQPEHAYTERGQTGAGSSKYEAEYALTRENDLAALDRVWAGFRGDKPLGGLQREVLDTATRLATRLGDARAVDLADAGKSCWKPPFAGLALGAAEAYVAAGRYSDAVLPLLQASTAGAHHPILALLEDVLGRLESVGPDADTLQAFRAVVHAQAQRGFDRTGLGKAGAGAGAETVEVDVRRTAAVLGVDEGLVRQVLGRLQRHEDVQEKSVREL